MTHSAGNFAPSRFKRAVRPFVVAEVEMSTSTGSPPVGNPAAMGFGVNTGSSPPKGATLAALGSEQASSITKPSSVARFR